MSIVSTYVVRTNNPHKPGHYYVAVEVAAESFEDAVQKRVAKLSDNPEYDSGTALVTSSNLSDAYLFAWTREHQPVITVTASS